jgi:hypothetical protein
MPDPEPDVELRMKTKYHRAALCLVLVTLGAVVAGWFVIWYGFLESRNESSRPQTGNPFDAGKAIIAALEKYRVDYHSYPPALGALTANYLKTIPEPGWGTNVWNYQWSPVWEHQRIEGGVFELSVLREERNYVCHYYNSVRKTWHYDN